MENIKKIKPNSYYSIQYWMINELGLKGLELSIYAIIYGFSRDHCGAFTGSRSYLADFTNSTKAGVDKALKSLIQKNLLEKKDFVNHGIKNCIYVAKEVANLVSYQSTELGGVANSVSQGSQLSCPNNIEDNTLSLETKHFGSYGNVILNDELYDRLLIESEEYANEYIERLDSHIEIRQLQKVYAAYSPKQFYVKILDMLVKKMNDAHSILNELVSLKQSRDSKKYQR